MPKKLLILNGAMGVGKTAVCRALMPLVEPCVFLDGDWCWDMRPFVVNDETKAMVTGNIRHMLGSFLRCSAYENVLFCWVLHHQEMIDELLAGLREDGLDFTPYVITLTATEAALRGHLQKDIDSGVRKPDVLARATAYLPLYQQEDTIKLDVSALTAEQAARRVCEILTGDAR